jgi:hypothetical protein
MTILSAELRTGNPKKRAIVNGLCPRRNKLRNSPKNSSESYSAMREEDLRERYEKFFAEYFQREQEVILLRK